MTEAEAAKKSRAAYYREYRKKNPEKIREIQERYWLKKARKLMESANEADGENQK